VKAVHVSDEHEEAPLLPPNALDTSYIQDPSPKIVVNNAIQQARNYYDWIKKSITQYTESQRKFLVGSFYSRILGNPFCVQPEMGCVINIDLGPSCGVVQVGLCSCLRIVKAVHVSDEHEEAPLLPPNALDTSYVQDPSPKIVVNNAIQQARNYYDWIKKSITQFFLAIHFVYNQRWDV
jgi:hypothetical protein